MVFPVRPFLLRRIWEAAMSLPHELRGMRVGRLVNAERRRAPRVKCYNLVKWIRAGELMNHRVSNVRDISVLGLRFSAREHIAPDTVLRMILNVAESNRQIPLLAKVIWSRAVGLGAYQAGVSFVEISNEDRVILGDLVHVREKDKV